MVPHVFSESATVNILAKTLYYEARGEGEVGLRAVASVIKNRAMRHSKKSNGTTCVREARRRKQFSCWNGKKDLPVGKGEAWIMSIKIAKELNEDTFVVTHHRTSYYNYKQVTPPWSYGLEGIIIGNHRFVSVEEKS